MGDVVSRNMSGSSSTSLQLTLINNNLGKAQMEVTLHNLSLPEAPTLCFACPPALASVFFLCSPVQASMFLVLAAVPAVGRNRSLV